MRSGADGTLADVKHSALALLAALALLLLAGCVRVDGDLTISTQDTVSGEITVALERSAVIAEGEDPDALIDDIQEDLAAAPEEGVTGEAYDDGDFLGVTLTLTSTPLDRIASATSGTLRISHDGGQYEVTGDFSELSDSGQSGSDVPWQVDLSITFPHGVSDHDGELSGSTVTWHLSGGQDTLHATGPAPGGGLSAVWIVVIVVLVALLATLVWWLWRHFNGSPVAGLRAAGGRIRQRHAAARDEGAGGLDDLRGPKP